MKFPYIEFLGLYGEAIFRPMIPVTFKFENAEFKTYCLIDSGSDYSIFPIEIAHKFNIKLDKGSSHKVLGAGGNAFRIFKSSTEIELRIQKTGFRSIKLVSQLYFAESSETFLLGQKDFLNELKVTLNGINKEIDIHKQQKRSL